MADDHIITPQGIIHTQFQPAYVDVSVERDGVTYAGRLYRALDTSSTPEEPVSYEQKFPLRSPDGKILLRCDGEGVWAWSRRVKDWQVFGWDRIARVHRQIISREHEREQQAGEGDSKR